MKKSLLLIMTAVVLFSTGSCNAQKKVDNKKVKLTTEQEEASYALGMQVGDNLSQQGLDTLLIPEFIIAGIKDQLAKNAQLDQNAANMVLNNFFTKLQQAQFEDKIAEGEKFLAENGKRPEVTTTASGLQYEIITEGNGPKPTANSTVRTHYKGTLLDGTTFDSSYDRGEPISFPLNGVIRAWTEGLQLMPVGSKWRLFVPYELGYGERGAGQIIGPYETLIFEVELLEIEK